MFLAFMLRVSGITLVDAYFYLQFLEHALLCTLDFPGADRG